MLQTNKVIWKEGIFLQPQHFQLLERFLLETLNARIVSENSYFYGLTEMVLDEDALSNGTLVLRKCSGILPDGTCFSIPRNHSAPPSKTLSDLFSHQKQHIDFYLGVALVKEGRCSVGYEQSDTPSRFRSFIENVPDEVTGGDPKEIELGNLNFRLFLEGEPLDDFSCVIAGRIKRNADGKYVLQEDRIPPLLRIDGSRFLMNNLRSLLELLYAKSSEISEKRSQLKGGMAKFSSSDESLYRLLELINSYTPLLEHYYSTASVHPFELFKLLTMFSGGMSVFSSEINLKNFPRYDHQQIWAALGSLMEMIRKVLDADLSAGCIRIPFEQVEPSIYVCKIKNERLFSEARFFLGVSAGDIPEKELIVGSLQRIKMSSRDRLELLISSALPGLPLLHVANPPENLPKKQGFVYFCLDQQDRIWDGMRSSGTIAFYFPHSYPELNVELIALRE